MKILGNAPLRKEIRITNTISWEQRVQEVKKEDHVIAREVYKLHVDTFIQVEHTPLW